jgi:serine/threonine protein kinase/tetratricopeptide (TPR) repeat protein
VLQDLQPLDRAREALAPGYVVERELGRGGMAVVYLARVASTDRHVAIKLLHPDAASSVGIERFLREIRFAGKLTHPNILPVLDSGASGGFPFYTMPFVDGESLRALLDREGRIPLDRALAITCALADALHYAHAAGIVHRDIKPENVLLVGDTALLADFGIARAMDTAADDNLTLTTFGGTIGTPVYMSPEQASGDAIDGRTDIYSLALMLFEMLTGAPPFVGKSAQATIAQRIIANAPALSSALPEAPPHVERAIAWALSRDPNDRPATAAELALALTTPSVTEDRAVPNTQQHRASPTVIARGVPSNPDMPSIAVLPFANLSSDSELEFFCDGLTEEVIGALSRLRTLRVLGRTSSFALKGHRLDARAAGERLRVSTVVDGSVRRAGNRVRINAQLIDVGSGFELWSGHLDREIDDAFALQDEMAHAVATTLKATLAGGVTSGATPAIPGDAYEAYLRGRHALNRRTETDLHAAADYFQQVVERTPEFALAWSGLGESLLLLSFYGAVSPHTVMPFAKRAAEMALDADPTLAEAHSTLASVEATYDWSWDDANNAFERALALGPRSASVHQRYALDFLVPLGRADEARAAIERARLLEPLATPIHASLGVVRHLTGDVNGAVTELRHLLDARPDFVIGHYFLGGALRDRGDYVEALQSVERAISLTGDGGSPEMISARGQILARLGDLAGARAALVSTASRATDERSTFALQAQILTTIGEHAGAIAALERAVEQRETELIYLDARPVYRPLKGTAAFETLRGVVGLARS